MLPASSSQMFRMSHVVATDAVYGTGRGAQAQATKRTPIWAGGLSAVYNYLNGRVPATEVLFRIARYTGRPMEWFLVDETVGAALPASSGELAVPVSYAASGRGGEGT